MEFYDVDLEKVEALAKAGHDDKFMANIVGVSVRQWNVWKEKHPTFFAKLNQWKQQADQTVQNNLFKLANGWEEEVLEPVYDQRQGKIVMVKKIIKHKPNFNAQKFWLSKRQPKYWGDDPAPMPVVPVEVTHKGKVEHNIKLDDDDLEDRIVNLRPSTNRMGSMN